MENSSKKVRNELQALEYTFVELLRIKESLNKKPEMLSNFRRADRRILRVKKCIERETQKIASDLVSYGLDEAQINILMIEARNPA